MTRFQVIRRFGCRLRGARPRHQLDRPRLRAARLVWDV